MLKKKTNRMTEYVIGEHYLRTLPAVRMHSVQSGIIEGLKVCNPSSIMQRQNTWHFAYKRSMKFSFHHFSLILLHMMSMAGGPKPQIVIVVHHLFIIDSFLCCHLVMSDPKSYSKS